MNVGSRFDVNNTINMSSAYPGGRASGYAPPSANRFRVRNNSAGELGAVNQDGAMARGPAGPAVSPGVFGANNNMAGTPMQGMTTNGDGREFFGQPVKWWFAFLIVFALFVWASRRFNGGEKFTNIKMSVYNGIFLTVFIVLILNLLKVFAARFPIPGLAPLILAA